VSVVPPGPKLALNGPEGERISSLSFYEDSVINSYLMQITTTKENYVTNYFSDALLIDHCVMDLWDGPKKRHDRKNKHKNASLGEVLQYSGWTH